MFQATPQRPQQQHRQHTEGRRPEPARQVRLPEHRHRQQREIIERWPVIVLRIVLIGVRSLQVEQEIRIDAFVMVKRFDPDLGEAEPAREQDGQKEEDKAESGA